LRIIQRYFSSKDYSSNIYCLHAGSFGHDVCTGNFSVKICGVVPWRGIVNNITLKTSRTSYFLKTLLTTFYFSPLAVHTQYFSCVAVTNRDWPTFI